MKPGDQCKVHLNPFLHYPPYMRALEGQVVTLVCKVHDRKFWICQNREKSRLVALAPTELCDSNFVNLL